MRRTSLFLFVPLVIAPILAFALTIEPGDFYTDVHPGSPVSAGINLLTHEGVVQGYGNGFFGSSRQINRAEFLKMAIVALGHHPDESRHPELDAPSIGAAGDPYCFPDVRIGDWFSPPVCFAFTKGVVRGNPDGLFHPERTVNYAEALKMMTLLFGYDIKAVQSADWAEPYYEAAAEKQVDLPMTIRFDTPLTRALAARLVAAFLAESTGQLTALRNAEAGQYLPQTSSASSSSVSSSLSSSTSSSSSSNPISLFTLPPVSHFLVLGSPSDAIAAITLRSSGEISRISSAEVKLFNDISSIDTLELVRADTGNSVAILRRRTTTSPADYKQTYEVQFSLDQQPTIPADTDVPLVLRANIRGFDTNGSSDQLLQVRILSVTIHGNTSNQTTNIPALAPFPKHQTAFGRITQVSRLSPATAPISSGTGMLVSSFTVSGSVLPGKTLAVENMLFSLQRSGPFTVQNWSIGQAGSSLSVPCSVSQDGAQLSCANLGSIGVLPRSSPLTLEIRANLWVPTGSTGNSMEIDLSDAGTPETSGSIQWTDQSGHFKWIEGASPIAKGTKWQ